MRSLLRRIAPWAAIGAIVLVLAGSIGLLAIPAATSHAAVRGCSAVAAAAATTNDGPDDILPSSSLDGIGRQCGGNPWNDQSLDEAIAAGAGLVVFGGAMLVYRQRRTQHPRRVARA